MKYKSGCLLCGQELVYLGSPRGMDCEFCGQSFESNVSCDDGHYICDACHSSDAYGVIDKVCLGAATANPVEMAITLMKHPALAMHGPEHHYLVPAVLLAAYHCKKPDTDLVEQLKQARKRAEGVNGGSCGFCGNCGAAVGTGIFISIITGSTPLSREEWRLSNTMTATSLMAVATHGGPRCCKRDTYLALQAACEFLDEKLGVRLEVTDPVLCQFSDLNRQCLGEEFPFHVMPVEQPGTLS